MHPSDLCKHGSALPLCNNGCIEELNVNNELLLERVRAALNERVHLLSNLTATHLRCNELLNENRRLNKELAAANETIAMLHRLLAKGA